MRCATGARGEAAPGPIVANRLDASARWLPGWTASQAGLALVAVFGLVWLWFWWTSRRGADTQA